MNSVLKYWFEYDGGDGADGKARKVLTAEEVNGKLDSHLASIVKFMENHMIFPDTPPESDIVKCMFIFYRCIFICSALILFILLPS